MTRLLGPARCSYREVRALVREVQSIVLCASRVGHAYAVVFAWRFFTEVSGRCAAAIGQLIIHEPAGPVQPTS